MGVQQVFRIVQDGSLDCTAAVALLDRVVKTLHPKNSKPWSIKSTIWRQALVKVDEMQNMTETKGSLKDMVLVDIDKDHTVLLGRSETVPISCTPNMADVLKSMQFSNSVALLYAGMEYDLGDFEIRIGTVVRKANDEIPQAVILIVHYLPCRYIQLTAPLMLEFQQILEQTLKNFQRQSSAKPTTLERIKPDFGHMPDAFSTLHLGLLYWHSAQLSNRPKPGAAAPPTAAT